MSNPRGLFPAANVPGADLRQAKPDDPRRLDESRLHSTARDALTRAAIPSTRRFVRRHPYAGLLGAALFGIWLVRGYPLRMLSRSVVFGWAARRFFTSLLSGGFAKPRSAPLSRGVPNQPR